MILLSLALVVASATALAFGLFTSSDQLVWVSLAAGLGAVALVAGSVVRHRRHLVPDGGLDAGQATAGSATAVGAASAGEDPAPSPTPSRPAASPAGPVSPPGARPGTQQGVQHGAPTWPWATPPPGSGAADPPSGWTGPVPVVRPPAADAAPGQAPADPAPVADSASGAPAQPAPPAAEAGEPGIEQVAVRDALRVAQLADEVLVVDGHPRYHLVGCTTLAGAETIPLAVSAARRGGFTPCAVCRPDATLLDRSRARQELAQKAQERAAGWLNTDRQQD